MRVFLLLGLGLSLSMAHMACGSSDEPSKTTTTTSSSASAGGAGGVGGAGGAGGSTPAPTICATEMLDERPFDTTGPFGFKRHDIADDFTLPLLGGSEWTLSEEWTGCESYLLLTNARAKSALDDASLWEQDLDELVSKSPLNAHYFFVAARTKASAEQELADMQERIDGLLATLEPTLQEHWKDRLHVVAQHYSDLDGWLKTLLSGFGLGGVAIDRAQQVRTLGSFADVNRYKSSLNMAGKWPWESNLAYATHEVRQYNYEAKRAATMAAEPALTVVTASEGTALQGKTEIDVTFPDAATMAGFDTLQIDLVMDCPDPDKGEFGNCGAWDYLSYIHLLDKDAVTWIEMSRFITTYHREGHYLVEATAMLAHLLDGGARKIRFDASSQKYLTRIDFRFSNRAKGYGPKQIVKLFAGGDFNSGYNDKYTPIDVPIPQSAKRVELWAVITGHGHSNTKFNCSEFCQHQHEFTIDGKLHLEDHPDVGDNESCIAQIENGIVPNQGGTWWFGRGGWCPGQQVDPWIVDVTADVTPGQTATVSYKGLYKGQTPPDGAGNIRMSSYLVIHE